MAANDALAVSRTRNIRFGRLEPRLVSAAATSGMTISEWVRQAIARALHEGSSAADLRPRAGDWTSEPPKLRRRCVLRVSNENFERWQAEACEHELALTRYIELQMSVTPARNHRIATAVEVARRATVELAAVGRNLNQLARSWNTYPGQSSARERELLAGHCSAVDRLSAQLSRLVAELNTQQGPRRKST